MSRVAQPNRAPGATGDEGLNPSARLTVQEKLLRILSLGAGVQSSTLALMFAHGELPPIDAAIFADTQGEPREVYRWLDWLENQVQQLRHPFPIHRVTRGNLWESATRVRTTRDGERSYIETAIPVFMLDGLKRGMGQRHCTRDFKINPVTTLARKLTGRSRITKNDGVLVEMIMGISFDEVDRMKPHPADWVETSWPLVDAEMTRLHCIQWMRSMGYPEPPRSACTFCPFHSDDEWMALEADELADVARREPELQAAYASASAIKATPYLHVSRVPLSQVQFRSSTASDMFRNECAGFCGV